MTTLYNLILFLLIPFLLPAQQSQTETKITGDLMIWHKMTILFEGPETSEMAVDNPFLHYRLDVTFKQGDHSYTVPGFYAADGNSAESGSASGNKWMVRFTPDKPGEWQYRVSFQKGENVAVKLPESGMSGGYMDGEEGSFLVKDLDQSVTGNRAKGRLEYVDGPYLRFQGSGQYFIKVGVDAPENILAYADFDATPNVEGRRKSWAPHAQDFEENAKQYVWQGTKGKNLLGAIRYLASEGLNAFSFLTFNVDGDDRNVFPHLLKVTESEYEAYSNVKKNKKAWDTMVHKTRFDVSKLDQWERIFEYAETQGMFLHFKTQETETDHLMDGGELGLFSKLYYRELIARFGHHLALNWNLGEENTQPIPAVIATAEFIDHLDPYNHPMVIHTYPSKDERYAQLTGGRSILAGASLQLSDRHFRDVHDRVLKWRTQSKEAGRPWVIAVDEPGDAKWALLTDEENPSHDSARVNALWGTLMAGGYGVEWYFGYASPNSDLTCQDFRSRDLFWNQNKAALEFFNQIPFWRMDPSDDLTSDNRSWCLAEKNQTYVVYLPPQQRTTSVNLGNTGYRYTLRWYNPRKGRFWKDGKIIEVSGKGMEPLGDPPADIEEDWVVLLERQ